MTSRVLKSTTLALLSLTFSGTAATAQAPNPSSKAVTATAAPQTTPTASPTDASIAAVSNHLDSMDRATGSRLDSIERATSRLEDKIGKTDYTPAALGFMGVVLGGLLTFLTQNRILAGQRKIAQDAAANDRALADAKAQLEIRAATVQWKLKQLSELYGPLYALLLQSHALYRHMNTVLATKDPELFRLRADPDSLDFDRQLFEIYMKGEWVRFRTVLHLDQVYGKNFGIEDYFNEVVAIGARMVKVVQEKAGFARPDQSELATLFGRYLAHFSVLERVHAHLKSKFNVPISVAIPAPMNVDASAVFPQEIQKLVGAGYEKILFELNEWGAKVRSQ